MPTAAADRRRAVPAPARLRAGAALLAVLVCLLHTLCGGAAQADGRARAVVGHGASTAAVATGDRAPDPGPHHHPASLARRVAPHLGPQHRALRLSGHDCCACARPPQPPAGSLRAVGRTAVPPAGSDLPHTVLRC